MVSTQQVLNKCWLSPSPSRWPQCEQSPLPHLPLCRNCRDITACRFLPSPSQREKRKQKAKQSLVPSSKPLPGSAEVLLMGAGQAYRNQLRVQREVIRQAPPGSMLPFMFHLISPKTRNRCSVLSSGALLLPCWRACLPSDAPPPLPLPSSSPEVESTPFYPL